VMLNPTFPEEGITREKALQLAALRRSQDSATDRPEQLLRAAMFGDHPYGLNDRGSEATLAAIDRAALQGWWKSHVAAARALIVVVGNVSAEDVRGLMERQLGAMPRGAPASPPPLPSALPRSREAVEVRDRKQTAIMIGFPVVTAAHPDWPAMRMLQTLTGGLSGTFYTELRGRQSLAYVVFTRATSFANHGMFLGYLAGDASKEPTARKALLAEIRKLQGEGVNAGELARAKASYAGATRRSRETSAARALEYGGNYLTGMPLDAVDRILAAVPAIQVQDLQRVARQYLSGDDHVYAAVRGKAAGP
jgi:zinc protease